MTSRPVRLAVLGVAAASLGAIALARIATRPRLLECEAGRITHLARIQTGHQRAERVAFLDGGRLVAVTCPRYDRVVLYHLADSGSLVRAADIAVAGKPMALGDLGDRFLVLQRPSGDARHLEPGFWQAYSYDGTPLGAAFPVGYDPDDLALLAGVKQALVLLSGHSEGETNRPPPALVSVDLAPPDGPRILHTMILDRTGFDPTRLILSSRESHAAILGFDGSVVGVDLTSSTGPLITGTTEIANRAFPTRSDSGDDSIILPAYTQADVVPLASDDPRGPDDFVATFDPDEGRLIVRSARRLATLGTLALPGPGNLGTVRVTGLAYEPARRTLAVADRSGGLHILAHEGRPPRR
jgi:glycerol-3-phosphate acyltransferase PlsY